MPPKLNKGLLSTSAEHGDLAESPLPLDRFESMLLRMSTVMTESFNRCIEKLITSVEEKLTLRLDVQSTETFNANQKIDQLEKRIEGLQKDNESLQSTVKSLTTRIETAIAGMDELEQHGRCDNLLLHGVALPTDGSREGDLSLIVTNILNTNISDLNLVPENISTAHRVSRGAQQSASSNPKPPTIVIRFTHKSVRNNVLANRRKLKGRGITLTEQLTSRRAGLLRKANEMVPGKIQSAWSQEGKILIKSFSNRIVHIENDGDLLPFQ